MESSRVVFIDAKKILRAKQEYHRLMRAGKPSRAQGVLQELRDMGINVRMNRRGSGLEENTDKIKTDNEIARGLSDQRNYARQRGDWAEADRLLSEIRELGFDVEDIGKSVVRFFKRK